MVTVEPGATSDPAAGDSAVTEPKFPTPELPLAAATSPAEVMMPSAVSRSVRPITLGTVTVGALGPKSLWNAAVELGTCPVDSPGIVRFVTSELSPFQKIAG